MKFIISILLSSMMLLGCALQNDVRILESRLIALENRNRDLQAETERVRQEKAAIESQLEGYNKDLEEKDQSLRSQSAGLRATADRLRNEIQALGGKVEETDFRLREQLKALESSYRIADQRLARVEQNLNIEGPSGNNPVAPPTEYSASPSAAAAPVVAAPSGKKLSEDELYVGAKQSFDRGDYKRARDGFQRAVAEYPKGKYADSSQFWLGEISYREHDYENAILEYQKVIEKYPNGNKVRAALLKQGFAFDAMGGKENKANARIILRELTQAYPNSSEARIAQKKLKDL